MGVAQPTLRAHVRRWKALSIVLFTRSVTGLMPLQNARAFVCPVNVGRQIAENGGAAIERSAQRYIDLLSQDR